MEMWSSTCVDERTIINYHEGFHKHCIGYLLIKREICFAIFQRLLFTLILVFCLNVDYLQIRQESLTMQYATVFNSFGGDE